MESSGEAIARSVSTAFVANVDLLEENEGNT